MKMICKIISRLWQTGLAVGFLLATGVVGAHNYNVVGKVSCDGKGIAGAVVSDGEQVVLTGTDGTYGLRSSKQC